jgi:uncharacterized membrane protein
LCLEAYPAARTRASIACNRRGDTLGFLIFILFVLVVVYLIVPFVLLARMGGLNQQIENLERALRSLDNRLDRLALQPAGAPAAAAGSVAPDVTAPAQPAAAAADIIRDTRAPEAPPDAAPPEPEPIPGPEPIPEPPLAAAPPPPEEAPAPEQPSPEPAPEIAAASAGPDDAAAAAAPPTPPPPSSAGPNLSDLEKRFGTQWVVWVGGVALALGGILLVRYSIEQGLFGPGLRVICGGVLALVLVGLGELARRRELIAGLGEMPRAHIPSILTAAGTTVAYADVWAAYELYEFLSPAVAFLLLGLVALATLAAALVHGPALGGLGLVGAYVTPLLVSTQQPNYWALYVYLTVVTAAAYALARFRMWRWLAITAAAFSVAWMFVGIGDPWNSSLPAHAFYALAGFALGAVFIVCGLFYGPPAEPDRSEPLSSGVLAGYLLGAFMLVYATAHAPLALTTLFVLVAATVAITWRTDAVMMVVPAAAALAVLTLVHWALDFRFDILVKPDGPFSGAPPVWMIVDRNEHLAFAAAVAALFGVAGFWRQGRSGEPMFSIIWAACAVATPIVILIVLYYRIAELGRSIPFAVLALVLAAAYAVATDLLSRREPRPGVAAGSALFATGAVAALALALTFALEKGWLTVALSLMVPGIAWISHRRPLPLLRTLCGVIVILVMLRVAWDPRIVGNDVGTTPIFNWLLWGYGVPAVSFWLAAHILRKRADDFSARAVDSAAILFTALTAMLEIRHLMNDGDIYRPRSGLGELGLQVSTWLAMTMGFEHIRARTGSIIHDYAARIFGALAFATIVFGLIWRENPMRTGDPVGGPFFNYILIGYGIPAVLMAVLARIIRYTRPQRFYVIAAVTAIVLAMIYLTLEVRTLFHGPVLTAPFMSDAEDYTYSAVWLGFGVALLLVGIALKSQPARLASAAVVILDIMKVFLHDLAGVQGIYRALSFIGLGLVLIGIGWLYQRLLFPRRAAEEPPPT